MSYDAELVAAVKKLEEVAKSRDSSPRDFQLAFENARKTLERLKEDKAFLTDLRAVTTPQANAAFTALVSSSDQFHAFFTWEQKELMRKGLPSGLVSQFVAELDTIRKGMRAAQQPISEKTVLAAIDGVIEWLRVAERYTKEADFDAEVLARGTEGMIGIAAIAINTKAIPLEVLVPLSSVITSVGFGLFVAKDAIAEKPLIKRIRKYFGKRG